MGLAREVDDMMKQLQDAEKELKRKQDDAEQDMMMAGMVSIAGRWHRRQEGAFSLLSWRCRLFSCCPLAKTALGPASIQSLQSLKWDGIHEMSKGAPLVALA